MSWRQRWNRAGEAHYPFPRYLFKNFSWGEKAHKQEEERQRCPTGNPTRLLMCVDHPLDDSGAAENTADIVFDVLVFAVLWRLSFASLKACDIIQNGVLV